MPPLSLSDSWEEFNKSVTIHEGPIGWVEISGADATSFLHRMTSNDVNNLAVGDGFYNAILDRKGMVFSLFYQFRIETDRYLLIIPTHLSEKTKSHFVKMKFIQKVTIQEVSGRVQKVILGKEINELELEKFKGSTTTLLVKDMSLMLPLWRWFGSEEEANNLPFPKEGSPELLRLLEIESGFPRYGQDIGEQNLLLEMPTPVAHKRQKGCYPGQEVIERISAYGKGRTPYAIVPLKIRGQHSLTEKSPIHNEAEETVGEITSALYHPACDQTWMLARLGQKYLEKADTVQIVNGTAVIQSPPKPASPPTDDKASS